MSGVSIIDTGYRLSKPSERAEFDRKVDDCGAKCYQVTVELVDPPCVLTQEMLRDYLAQFMEHIEVDDEEYARQRFWESVHYPLKQQEPQRAPDATGRAGPTSSPQAPA